MKNFLLYILFISTCSFSILAQTNLSVSDAEVDDVLHGNYNPADYSASNVINDHQQIFCEVSEAVSADSLKAYLLKLATFSNRNTYSDTISSTTGMGAARRWALGKFEEFSSLSEGRLLPAYFDFEWPGGLCDTWIGEGPFRNVIGVLPGADIVDPELIIIEAHMDSRCEDVCDIDCLAEGMEDNGSGTALVLELARVMSAYTFNETIVFMITTGEEQGLYGASAFADYCTAEGIAIRQVQNNDVIGGIICGETSSPPACTEPGSIDSMNVRIFANTSPLPEHRNFARYVDYIYDEKLANAMPVPMNIAVQNQEDRTGRGGDHIPFRENGFTSIRFTSANEHGDGAPDVTYTDRQHTHSDVLGEDTNGDGVIDSFFVSFTYLQRNTIINAAIATLGALAPPVPEWELLDADDGLTVSISDFNSDYTYRVAVRTSASDNWQWMYRTNSSEFLVPGMEGGELYFISLAAVNSSGVTGLFSRERWTVNNATTAPGVIDDLSFEFDCLSTFIEESQTEKEFKASISCAPNPWSITTTIEVNVAQSLNNSIGTIWISDANGRMVDEMEIQLADGKTIMQYNGNLPQGMYTLTLLIDEQVLASTKMLVRK